MSLLTHTERAADDAVRRLAERIETGSGATCERGMVGTGDCAFLLDDERPADSMVVVDGHAYWAHAIEVNHQIGPNGARSLHLATVTGSTLLDTTYSVADPSAAEKILGFIEPQSPQWHERFDFGLLIANRIAAVHRG